MITVIRMSVYYLLLGVNESLKDKGCAELQMKGEKTTVEKQVLVKLISIANQWHHAAWYKYF